MNDGLSLPDNRRSPVICLHGRPMMHATYSACPRSFQSLTFPPNPAGPTALVVSMMCAWGFVFIHVMERHISNHALTDKVFSDKGRTVSRAASCGSSRGIASSISRASCEFFRRSAFSAAFQSSAGFVHQAGAVAGVRITASLQPHRFSRV